MEHEPMTWRIMGLGTAAFVLAGAAYLLDSPFLAAVAVLTFFAGFGLATREVVRSWIQFFRNL